MEGQVGDGPAATFHKEASVNTLSRVLAAVDCSSPARSAFDYALALARSNGAASARAASRC